MQSLNYQHRIVFVGRDWFIEVRGVFPEDQFELNEVLLTLKNIHGWPTSRQVLTNEEDEAKGEQGSIALNIHSAFIKAKQNEWRKDIMNTDWFKSALI